MSNVNIQINNQPLRHVTTAKYLGMFIDQNLKWDHHIDNMVSKISAKIGILRSLRNVVPINTMKLLYNAIVQPHFDYADLVYDSTSETNKARLQKLQTRAARLITGSKARASRNEMFKKLNWMSLQNRRNFHKCIQMYKCMNNLAPDYLNNYFQTNQNIHSHNTRNASQLRITRTNTEYLHKRFTVSSQKLWNNLPTHIQNNPTIGGFKNTLHQFLVIKQQF